MSKVIAVIPARYGSKRLPIKNSLEIQENKNLIQHAIDCALDSGVVDKAFVSSDFHYFHFTRAEFSEQPPHLSGDRVDITEAVAYCAEKAEQRIGTIDYVVTLQPAVVARSPLIVKCMVDAVRRTQAQGAVTAARTVPWQWTVDKADHATNAWWPGPYPRSQESQTHLCEINAVQIAPFDVVMQKKRWGLPLLLAELPHWAAALDIDEPEDMVRARELWPWARIRLETWEPPMHFVESINQRLGA